jgi:hypothetical protein
MDQNLSRELNRRVKAAATGSGKLDVSTTPNCGFHFKYVPSLVYSTFGVKGDENKEATPKNDTNHKRSKNETSVATKTAYDNVDLRELWLSNNNISVLTRELYSLPKLQVLCLSSNHLTAIPSSIGTLATLERLILNGNKITSIPADIMKLKKLQELRLDHNRLCEFPLCLTELKHLVRLGLSHNKIGPSIPAQIRNLHHLMELDLDHNAITGLPSTLVHLNDSLQQLGLAFNRLQAPLPTVLMELSNLDVLRLEGNRVHVVIDEETGVEKIEYTIPTRHDGYPELRTGEMVNDQHVVHKLPGYLEESFLYNRMNANWCRNKDVESNFANEVQLLKMRALKKPQVIKNKAPSQGNGTSASEKNTNQEKVAGQIKGKTSSLGADEVTKVLAREQSMNEVKGLMKGRLKTGSFRKK